MASRVSILWTIAALLIIVGASAERRYGEPEYDDPERSRRTPKEREEPEYDPKIRPPQRPRRHEDPEFDPDVPPRRPRKREDEPEYGGRDSPFLMKESKRVVRTDAGEMRVVRGFGMGSVGNVERPLHIGFITMEPRSLFVPQYLDSSLIIFLRRGLAKIGLIYKDKFVERDLKVGDVYQIPAGSVFYLVNPDEGQRLSIVCSIDPSESIGDGPFQSFYIGGGRNPASVLQGFDPHTLATAFNITVRDLDELMTSQTEGPIVYITDPQSHSPSMWNSFVELKRQDKLKQLKKVAEFERVSMVGDVNVEDEWKWSWRKLLKSIFGAGEDKYKGPMVSTINKGKGGGPDSYNLYDRNPDFKNDYGWSVALEEHDYSFLEHSGVSMYLVNLTAGSMMAPHINPTATEYGIVLRGSGSFQIVYPNGSSAINTQIKEGDVFMVPRYFPFCQIASRTGPLEFFGFTTSSRRNRPQFLVGASSILQTLRSAEVAAAFGVSVERLDNITRAQKESVILPTAEVAPGDVQVSH